MFLNFSATIHFAPHAKPHGMRTRPVMNTSSTDMMWGKDTVKGLVHTLQMELVPFPCHNSRISEHFWNVFSTFSCVIFPVISCSETREKHIFILFEEFLVICTCKTQEIHFTIEYVTRNVHYSRETPLSILYIQLVLFLGNTHVSNLCHS